jgi:tetratricopeptide (TPR) repeat protein
MNLGILSHFQGDAETASRHYHESLEHFQAVGELSGVASCLVNLGHLSLGSGEFDAARAYFTRSQKMFQALGDDYGSANTLCSLGSVAVEQGQLDVALQHFKAALKQSRAIGAIPLVLEIMVGLAKIALNSGEPQKAAALLALAIHHPATTYEVKSAAEALVEPVSAAIGIRAYEAIIAENQAADLDQLLNPYIESSVHTLK